MMSYSYFLVSPVSPNLPKGDYQCRLCGRQLTHTSGIGQKDILDAVGIKQVIDLHGVGENFQGESHTPLPEKSAKCLRDEDSSNLLPIFLNYFAPKPNLPPCYTRCKVDSQDQISEQLPAIYTTNEHSTQTMLAWGSHTN